MAQDMPIWLHGKISRDKAEQLLKPWQDGFFLVRESTHYPGDFTLCVCISGRVEHYHIITTPTNNPNHKTLTIDEEAFFPNLIELVKHYTADADGLVCSLQKPVPRRHDALQPESLQKARRPDGPPPESLQREVHVNNRTDGSQKSKHGSQKDMKNQFLSSHWAINKKDVILGEEIGHGFFGAVRVGEYRNQKVAVKLLLGNNDAAQSILAEASIMTELRHPNLVALIGVSPDTPVYIVLEFMAKGNLLDYVRSRGRSIITKKLQLKFSLNIVAGMVYLEQKSFVHRDLAARNILISEDDIAKVSDFGLAQDNDQPLVGGKIPVKWTAPEAFRDKNFTTMSDVWSFGILLWELFSFGRVPYPRVPADDVMAYLEDGNRMASPGENCKDVYEVMQKCWKMHPEERPKFSELERNLKSLAAAVNNSQLPSIPVS